MAAAKTRVDSAEKEWESVKRKKSKRRTALSRMTRQELLATQDSFKQVSGSEEMRRFRDGLDLHAAHEVMVQPEPGCRQRNQRSRGGKCF